MKQLRVFLDNFSILPSLYILLLLRAMSVLFTFAKAILFEWKDLSIKQLTDRGIPMTAAFYYERLALYPSVLLMAVTFRWEYVDAIRARPLFLGALLFGFFFWILQEYIGFYLVEEVQNLGFLSAFGMAIKLPVFAAVGWMVNGDVPSVLMLAALAALTGAMFLKPAAVQPGSTLFRKGFLFTAAIALLSTVFDAVNVALGRFLLVNIQSTLFLVGLFSALSCAALMLKILLWSRLFLTPR